MRHPRPKHHLALFSLLILAGSLALIAVPGLAPRSTAEAQGDPPTATLEPAIEIPTEATPEPASAPQQPSESEPAASAAEQVLVEALVGEIRKLNPLLATYNPVDRDISALIFEGLSATNAYGEIVPRLAESWRVSDDGLQVIVALRQDVRWHDGMPFTAEDVVFTMRLLSAPDFPGAAELSEFWRTVEVELLDAHTVRFRLTQPLASFPDQLRIGIVPEHVLRGVTGETLAQHPFNLDPIGTGPYQFEALTAASGALDGVQLRLAPVYRQRPDGATGFALERIVFRTYPTAEAALDAYAANQVNSVGIVPPTLRDQAQQLPGLSLYTGIAPQLGVLIYNWDRDSVGFVRNPRIRLALAHAIDRAALVAEHLAGVAVLADSPLLPNSWAYDPAPWPAYDLARAQQLMETAGDVFEAPTATPEGTPAESEPAPEDAPPAEGEASAPETEAPDEGEPAGEAEAPAEGEPPAEGEAPAEQNDATPTPTVEPTAIPTRAMMILVPQDPALEALAGEIAAAWSQLGFDAGVQAVAAEELTARLDAGDFDMALVELSFEPYADPDPYVFWHQGQHEGGQNFGAMDDRRISEMLEMARREFYGVNRAYFYSRFQELFAQRAPALPLYYPLITYGADARLEGIQIGFLSTAADRFRTIADWRFTS